MSLLKQTLTAESITIEDISLEEQYQGQIEAYSTDYLFGIYKFVTSKEAVPSEVLPMVAIATGEEINTLKAVQTMSTEEKDGVIKKIWQAIVKAVAKTIKFIKKLLLGNFKKDPEDILSSFKTRYANGDSAKGVVDEVIKRTKDEYSDIDAYGEGFDILENLSDEGVSKLKEITGMDATEINQARVPVEEVKNKLEALLACDFNEAVKISKILSEKMRDVEFSVLKEDLKVNMVVDVGDSYKVKDVSDITVRDITKHDIIKTSYDELMERFVSEKYNDLMDELYLTLENSEDTTFPENLNYIRNMIGGLRSYGILFLDVSNIFKSRLKLYFLLHVIAQYKIK